MPDTKHCLSYMLVLFTVMLLVKVSVSDVVVSRPPQNATAQTGSTVLLECSPQSEYTAAFEWTFYDDNVGAQIYYYPPYTPQEDFPQHRFQQVDKFGLQISSLELTDGGVYGCTFVMGDVHKFATVVVVGTPMASISPEVVNPGDEVYLTCSVQFGGPLNGSANYGTGQFPQLDMSFNGEPFHAPVAPMNYTPGHPGARPHVMKRTVKLTATQSDAGKLLECRVSTQSPAFSAVANKTLNVQVPAYDIAISPEEDEFAVGDVITCTAQGYPPPTIEWVRDSTGEMVPGPTLEVTEEMLGDNVWLCTAANEFNTEKLTKDISFTVVETDAESESSTSNAAVIGIGVGVAIGALLLIAGIIILIVCLVKRRKSQAKGGVDDSTSQPFIYVPKKSEAKKGDGDITSKNGKPHPAARPRTGSTNAELDSAGHADLGGANIRAASNTSLDRSFDNTSKPRPADRSKEPIRVSDYSLDKSYDKPKPAERPKTGFRGSTESLDKSFDKPVPTQRPKAAMRGSTESLDRSIDSTGKPVSKEARPRPTERPKAALRGSTESLDKLTDGGRPQPVERPKAKDRSSLDRSLDSDTKVVGPPQGRPRPDRPPKPSKDQIPTFDKYDTDV